MPESRYLGIEASQFFDLLPDPMWVFDPATLKFLDVNGAALLKLGYSRQQFLGMTIADIRPESDRPLIRMAVDTVSDGEFSGGVWRILTADGQSLYLDFHWRTMSFNGRRAILACTRDVTHL